MEWFAGQCLDHALFVDDDLTVQKAFRRVMQRTGVPVETYTHANEALHALEAEPTKYGAVVADLRLGQDSSGLDLLEVAAERAPWASRILVSGALDLETAMAAVNRCRVSQLLTKPWSLEDLRDAVRDGIDRAYLGLRTRRSLTERPERHDETGSLSSCDLAQMTPFLTELVAWSPGAVEAARRRRYAAELAAVAGVGSQDALHAELAALTQDLGTLNMKSDRSMDGTMALHLGPWQDSARLLAQRPELEPVAHIVAQLGERHDGLGEPAGLAGEEIAVGARLVRVVTLFDLVTGWPRDGHAVEKGRARVQDEAGSQLDPHIVNAFLEVPAERWVELTFAAA